MTVFIIVLWGLVGEGKDLDAKPITPECGATHCQITTEDAQAIARMQATQMEIFRQLREENERLKKRASCRGSST